MAIALDPKKLKAACRSVAKELKHLPTKDDRMSASDLADLVARAEPGEPFETYALMLLLRATLPPAGRSEKAKRFESTSVHHGDLLVERNLAVTTDLWASKTKT